MDTLSCFNPFSRATFNFSKRGKRTKPHPRERYTSTAPSTILSNDDFIIPTVTVERQRFHDPEFDRFPADIGGDSTGPPSYSEILSAFSEPPPSYQQAILSRVPDEDVSQVRTVAWVRASGDLITNRTNDCPRVHVVTAPTRSRSSTDPTSSSGTTAGQPSQRVDTPPTIQDTQSSVSPGTRRRIRQSWTHCLQWIVQYSIVCNFRSTIAHFLSMVTQALHMKKEHGVNSNKYPIAIRTLAVQLPSTFSRRMWSDLIFAFGFSTSSGRHTSQAESIIVPSTMSRDELTRYRQVLTGLIELPYYTVKTAASLDPQETEYVVALLSYTLTSHNDLLSLDNYLVKPVWEAHKRPWLLLQSLDFAGEIAKRDIHKSNKSETLLRLPIREVERYRLQLTRTILMAFTEEYTQIL